MRGTALLLGVKVSHRRDPGVRVPCALATCLARLRHFQEARSTLDRAIETAQQVGDFESAGNAALTIIEHLSSELTDDDLAATLVRAEVLLENTQDTNTIRRLAKCACHAASLLHASPEFPSTFNWAALSFDQELIRYGKHLIELALKRSEGSVTDAARLLDLSHQNLSSKIVRYKELAKFRKPIRQRKRSSIDRKSEGEAGVERGNKTHAVMILLVEDNQIVAGAIGETLEINEWKVETCMDGTTALERIASDAHYDLMLLDYTLPDLDGLQLVKRARQLAHRSQTPIIMLSASPVEAAARDAGVNVFLPKPQDIGSLAETINRLLEERDQEQ